MCDVLLESGSGSSSSERRHSRSDSASQPTLLQPHPAAAPEAPPGRVYHNIWRNAHNSSTASLPSLRDLAQTLIERGNGGASSSMAREVGSISSLSELADPLTAELRRPASYRWARRRRVLFSPPRLATISIREHGSLCVQGHCHCQGGCRCRSMGGCSLAAGDLVLLLLRHYHFEFLVVRTRSYHGLHRSDWCSYRVAA